MEKRAFQNGFYRLAIRDVAAARIRLMALFEVTTRQGLRDRVNGKVNHTDEQINAVEEIFHSYGITNIWGKV